MNFFDRWCLHKFDRPILRCSIEAGCYPNAKKKDSFDKTNTATHWDHSDSLLGMHALRKGELSGSITNLP